MDGFLLFKITPAKIRTPHSKKEKRQATLSDQKRGKTSAGVHDLASGGLHV